MATYDDDRLRNSKAGKKDSTGPRLSQLYPPCAPAECRTARTKPDMALAEIGRAIAAGVRFGCVLADAGDGLSAILELFARLPPQRCPHCRKWICNGRRPE